MPHEGAYLALHHSGDSAVRGSSEFLDMHAALVSTFVVHLADLTTPRGGNEARYLQKEKKN